MGAGPAVAAAAVVAEGAGASLNLSMKTGEKQRTSEIETEHSFYQASCRASPLFTPTF